MPTPCSECSCRSGHLITCSMRPRGSDGLDPSVSGLWPGGIPHSLPSGSLLADAGARGQRTTLAKLPEGITEAMQKALHWLCERDGEGVFNNDHQILARGSVCPALPSTWRRIIERAYVTPNTVVRSGTRVRITQAGRDFCAKFPLLSGPISVRHGRVDPHEGAE